MKSKESFYGWRIVIGAVLVLAVTGPAGVSIANIYQGSVTEALGISNAQFSISNTLILSVSVLFGSWISGLLAKNFTKVFMIASLVYGLAYMAFGLVNNTFLFYLLSILVGFGFLSTSAMAMSILISNWFVEKRGLALSIALSGIGIGGIIWSPIVTNLINSIGWRASYMTYGAIMIAVTLLVGKFIFVAKPEDMGLEALGANTANQTSATSQKENLRVPFNLKESVRKPFFILLLLGAVFVGLSNNGGLGQFPPYMQSIHGAQLGALIISVYSAVGILGKLLLGSIADKFGVVVATIWTSVALALTYFLAATTTSYGFAILLAVLFGLGNANGTVLAPLVVSAIYPTKSYAQVYGLVNQFLFLGMMFGSLIAASIADAASYTTAWYVFAVISLLIIVFWAGSYFLAKKDFKPVEK
ncbi:MFS transporter [Aerococcus agrisoli]|nr:MFS transporter [Aerococcus agrisoli]